MQQFNAFLLLLSQTASVAAATAASVTRGFLYSGSGGDTRSRCYPCNRSLHVHPQTAMAPAAHEEVNDIEQGKEDPLPTLTSYLTEVSTCIYYKYELNVRIMQHSSLVTHASLSHV